MKLQFFFIRLIIFVLLIFSTATLFVMEAESENEETEERIIYIKDSESENEENQKNIHYVRLKYGRIAVAWGRALEIYRLGKDLHDKFPIVFLCFYHYLNTILEGELMQIKEFPSERSKLISSRDIVIIRNSGLTMYGSLLPLTIVSMSHVNAREISRSGTVQISLPFEMPVVIIDKKMLTEYSSFPFDTLWRRLEEKRQYVCIRHGKKKVDFL